jgi:hypothetical protein
MPSPEACHPRAGFRKAGVTKSRSSKAPPNPRSERREQTTKYHQNINMTRTKQKASNTSAFIVPDDVDTDSPSPYNNKSSSNVHSSRNSRMGSDSDIHSEEIDGLLRESRSLRVDVVMRRNANKRLVITRKKK